jgi:hypothetical protein
MNAKLKKMFDTATLMVRQLENGERLRKAQLQRLGTFLNLIRKECNNDNQPST